MRHQSLFYTTELPLKKLAHRLGSITSLYLKIGWLIIMSKEPFFQNNLKGSSDSDDDPKHATIPLVDVRMIDFAHVFDGEPNCLDENYLFGINNLILTIESI